MTLSGLIEVTTKDGIRVIQLARPAKRNALSTPLLTELLEVVEDTRRSAAQVRVVVITGAGGHFSAGADIGEFNDWDPDSLNRYIELGSEAFARLADLPQPVIAAIEGVALGGGLELALACDLRVADDSAVLGFPEVVIGGVPGWGGTVRLQEAIGRAWATRLILTGARIGAAQAAQLGLVDEHATGAGAMEAAIELAALLATRSPTALRLATRAVRRGSPYSVASQAELELYANLVCMTSPERHAAVGQFLGNRSSASTPSDTSPR